MTFLNPLVLLGLMAAAIPLIIHLFNFRRPKRVEFSSLAFLREVQRSTMQRVRIKQWLLLLLRTLTIAAIVLAFARPSIRGSLAGLFGSTAPSAVAIIVDDSPSMILRDADGGYLDQAREVAQAIGLTTDQKDEVYVLTTSGGTGMDSTPGGAAVAARAAEVAVSPTTGSVESAVRRAMDALAASEQTNREVFVVGDLQTSTLTDTTDQRPMTTGFAEVRLVPIGERSEANVAIVAARVVSRIIEVGQPVRIEADLVNFGPSAVTGYAVSVESVGVRLAQTSVDLNPGERTTASLVLTPQARGWMSAAVETEEDAFQQDNAFYFTLLVPDRRRILLVVGDGVDSRFVETALSERLTGQTLRFEVTRVPERVLPSTNLSDFDVVLLSGPVDLSSGESDRLSRFVLDGGGVLWYPGRDARTEDYNRLLSELGGGRVTGWSETSADGRPVDSVDRLEAEHPLFDGMFGGGSPSFEQPVLYRRMNYEPAGAAETTIISLAGGSPFLQEIRAGRGTVLLLTTSPDPAWSDLPTRGLFLPLLYRSVFLLSSTSTISGEQFVVGGDGQLFLSAISETQKLEIEGPSGETVAPVVRGVAGGSLIGLEGVLDEAGVYVVRADDRDVYRFAANPDAREGDLARLAAVDAAERLANRTGLTTTVMDLESGDLDRARTEVAAARRGVELWNVFLMIALLCMVAESAVAAAWKPEAAG